MALTSPDASSLKGWRSILSCAVWGEGLMAHEPEVWPWCSQVPTITGISVRFWFSRRSPTYSSQEKSEQTNLFFLPRPNSGLPSWTWVTTLLPTPRAGTGKGDRGHWCPLGRLPSLSKHQCAANAHLHRNWAMAQSSLLEGQEHSIQDASSGVSRVY